MRRNNKVSSSENQIQAELLHNILSPFLSQWQQDLTQNYTTWSKLEPFLLLNWHVILLALLSQGRGCTYSYCTKYQRCSTCSQESACGWCDSLQQCLPGTSVGPYAKQCPDWFYYTCYTVGSVNHCSDKIQVTGLQERLISILKFKGRKDFNSIYDPDRHCCNCFAASGLH